MLNLYSNQYIFLQTSQTNILKVQLNLLPFLEPLCSPLALRLLRRHRGGGAGGRRSFGTSPGCPGARRV